MTILSIIPASLQAPIIENPKNGHGYTLLNLALLGGSPDIVRELVRQVDVHEKNDDDI